MTRVSVAALVAVCVFSFSASAQPQAMRPAHVQNIICPAQVQLKFVATNPAALSQAGWNVNDGPFLVQLDPANPPVMSGGNLVCYYKVGSQNAGFNILQPIGKRNCSVLSNKTGFVCS